MTRPVDETNAEEFAMEAEGSGQDVDADTDAELTHALGEAARKPRFVCAVTGKERAKRDLFRLDTLRPTLAERLRQDHPELGDDSLVSRQVVARYRNLYVEDLLKTEHGEFSELEREVAESIAAQDTISENTEDDFEEHRTLADRWSDGLAAFGGSWAFLIAFGAVLLSWMLFNLATGEGRAFDPYPFILLNLVLSCIAAVQAPIIMMSQKRQEAKDRLRSLNDYQVNLKAELEIRHLHEKVDYLITKQWQRLAEIQQIQLEIMLESRKRK